MYCHTLKLLAVSLAVASANGTSDESATTNNTGGGGARRLVPAAAANDNRRRRQRTGGLSVTPSNYESVSETPLTFEYVETYPDIDRERILAEAEIRGEDWDEEVETETEMVEEQAVEEGEDEGVFIHEDEDAVDVEFMDLEEYIGVDGEDDEEQYSPDETEYEFVYTDMEPDVVPYTTTTWTESSSDVDAGANDMDFYDEIEERDIVIKPEEEEEMDGEGSMEVDHEPLLFETKDIRRRLRRLDAPVIVSEENEDDMERYLADKESLRDDTLAIFDPALDANGEFDLHNEDIDYFEDFILDEGDHRELQSGCSGNQKRAKIQIKTDLAGWESRWEVRRANGAIVTRGPPAGRRYADNKSYLGGICLPPGQYRFIMYDKFSDGMCGSRTGRGWYGLWVAGVKRASSPGNCSVNWGKRVHTFRIVQPQNNPAPNPAPAPAPSVAISGRGGCYNVKVQFKVDKFGRETTAMVTGGGRTHMKSANEVGAFQTKTMAKCLPAGSYTMKMVDRDGICCSNGKGWYKMSVNGQTVISGAYFLGSKSHSIRIGSSWQNGMSSRAREWLAGHNTMRRKYNGGKGYRPLRWSRGLAANAQSYANQLGNNCKNGGLVHAKNVQDGENLAKNKGSGSWGARPTVAKIMNRWVTNEVNWAYPSNAHYTQVIWRATQYTGCGESVRQYGNQFCRVQVCRYTRPGNCNVRNKNWRAEAFKDDTGCGRACPGEGCFI